MDPDFKPTHLLSDEMHYELRIRGVITNRPQEDRRKILARLLDKERQRQIDVLSLVDPNYNFENERVEIENTLESIRSLVGEFEGPTSDSLYKRLRTRLLHINSRISRMILDKGLQTYGIQSLFKNEAYATCLHLEAELHDRVQEPKSCCNNDSSEARRSNVPIFNTVQEQGYSRIPTEAVYKLGLKFDGDPNSVLSFVERVEEMSQARGISRSQLFESSIDLFAGKAIFWLRQVKTQVNDWDSLILRLKKDFLPADFDENIWQQIKSRRQNRKESVVLFIASMENYFSRLSHSVIEATKVKFIRLGLLSEYRKRLALHDVNSVEDLKALCRKLEEADILSLGSSSGSSQSVSVLVDPDVKFARKVSKNTKHRRPNVSSPPTQSSSSSRTTEASLAAGPKKSLVCWNCSQDNHTFRSCRSLVRNKFCFKCGSPGITVRSCPKCQGN